MLGAKIRKEWKLGVQGVNVACATPNLVDIITRGPRRLDNRTLLQQRSPYWPNGTEHTASPVECSAAFLYCLLQLMRHPYLNKYVKGGRPIGPKRNPRASLAPRNPMQAINRLFQEHVIHSVTKRLSIIAPPLLPVPERRLGSSRSGSPSASAHISERLIPPRGAWRVGLQ